MTDSKAMLTGQKYQTSDAIFQIKRSIRALRVLSGITVSDDVEKECKLAMVKKKEDKEKRKIK